MQLEELNWILDANPLGIIVQDESQKVVWVNQTLADWLVSSKDELLGDGIHFLAQLENGTSITLPKPHRQVLCSKVRHNDFTVWYLEDNSRLHQLEDEFIAMQAKHGIDNVTGLPNHNGILQQLESQVTRSRRYHNPLTIVLLSIRARISAVETGIDETMLIRISQLLKDQLRWADQIGRLDEENFLLILPETSSSDAHRIIDKLHSRIEVESKQSILASFAHYQWQRGDDSKAMLNKVRTDLNTEIQKANQNSLSA